MFEALSEKLGSVFGKLNNKGRLTERDIDEALREVRMALLEADVNFKVARNFVENIKEKALEQDLLTSLSPGQQVVKITNDALVEILGGVGQSLVTGSQSPSTMMLIGLNGAGKTTAAAKLANHLSKSGQSSTLIAADLQRPAAINQLETLADQVGVHFYKDVKSKDPADVASNGIVRAKELNSAWAIIDTAGRFQVDDDLMRELELVKRTVEPDETLLIVDAMTGQEAVQVADEFNKRIGVTGLILTKMDGDARGGAALSITSVSGLPIKFIGTGESTNALEQFYPDRLASRILGMGDVLTLIEKAQETFSQDQALELEKKIRQSTFDLNDFLSQLQQLQKMGPISQVMEMIPGFSSIKGKLDTVGLDDENMKRTEAIIYSMTPSERTKPEIIGGSRRKRIALGSGTKPQDVNQVLGQFKQAQKMMRQLMGGGKSTKKMRRLLKQQGGDFINLR